VLPQIFNPHVQSVSVDEFKSTVRKPTIDIEPREFVRVIPFPLKANQAIAEALANRTDLQALAALKAAHAPKELSSSAVIPHQLTQS